jgi:catechol 2,3-dioxygenase
MKIKSLGHVVLRVSDLARAEAFYGDLLGMPICARFQDGPVRMAFFTLGNHHDFAIMEVSGEGSATSPTAVGLDHVAFMIGQSIEELREANETLRAAGIDAEPVDHEVAKSLYFHDPDGNGVELYVDASDVWRREPQRVAAYAPMEL